MVVTYGPGVVNLRCVPCALQGENINHEDAQFATSHHNGFNEMPGLAAQEHWVSARLRLY